MNQSSDFDPCSFFRFFALLCFVEDYDRCALIPIFADDVATNLAVRHRERELWNLSLPRRGDALWIQDEAFPRAESPLARSQLLRASVFDLFSLVYPPPGPSLPLRSCST